MEIKEPVLRFASNMGLDQGLIDLYDEVVGTSWGKYPLDEQLRSCRLPEDQRKGDILISPIPAINDLCYRFGVLGHAFRTRGYRPVVLYDDYDLPVRPEFSIDDTDEISAIRCRHRARTFAKEFGFEDYSIGELIGSKTYDQLETETSDVYYRDMRLDDVAKSSTRKYLKRYSLNLSDPQIRTLYEQYLRGGAMLVDATKEIFDRYDIVASVVHEPNYIWGGIPLRVSVEEGANTYTQKWGYISGQLLFGRASNRHYMGQFAGRELIKARLNKKLNSEENAEIEEIIAKWRDNEVTDVDYTTQSGISVDTEADTVVGLFTNLLWDGALEPDGALYNDIYEWIGDTIDVFRDKTNASLVIKPHPAEHIRGTNESVGDWIQANYDTPINNVTLLSPDTKVDTYRLFNDLDLGLVYASTVGLELVYDGVPAVVAGYPPYFGFDITYDPGTKSEYRKLIEHPEELGCSLERQTRAKRYFHFLFFCEHFDFPYHTGINEGTNEGKETEIRHSEITPGTEPWDTIVQQMLAGEDVIQTNCREMEQVK